jgi:hypothetical protein
VNSGERGSSFVPASLWALTASPAVRLPANRLDASLVPSRKLLLLLFVVLVRLFFARRSLPVAERFVPVNPEEVVEPALPDRVPEEAVEPTGSIVEDGDGALERGDRSEEDVDGTMEDDDPAPEPVADEDVDGVAEDDGGADEGAEEEPAWSGLAGY